MPYIIYLLDSPLWLFNKVTVNEQRTRKEDDMKTFTSVISIFVLCVGLTLTGCAANGTVSSKPFADMALGQSVDFHKDAIQKHQNRVATFEQKIQKLEDRLDMVKNSYRDPKGLKRQSWTRLLSQWRGELQGLREHIVWHKEQIALLRK